MFRPDGCEKCVQLGQQVQGGMAVVRMRHVNQKLQSSQDNISNFEAKVVSGSQIIWAMHTILHEDVKKSIKPEGKTRTAHTSPCQAY
jgi:hypothetical protein